MPDTPPSQNRVIAILGGTGKEGPGLASRWALAGYQIIIGSRQSEKAQATAAELNAKLGTATIRGMVNEEAARAADLCILTVEQSAHQTALEGLKEALKGKVLVDATARVDWRDPRPPSPPAAARFAQQFLGSEVRVVAAFQNVPAQILKKNLDQPLEAAILVCADDKQAAQQVIELAQNGGMQAYYAGGLDNAVVVEGITSLLISMNQYYGIRTASIAVTGVQKG